MQSGWFWIFVRGVIEVCEVASEGLLGEVSTEG
jgi:hypothetical protein